MNGILRRLLALLLPAFLWPPGNAQTIITIGPETIHTGVKRLGINLSGQTFYDSGQMLRNLVFRNPGFEGETWQSILHCKRATANTCTDDNEYAVWPAGFLNGAHVEIISGAAKGQTATVASSSSASRPYGITVTLAASQVSLHAGDFLVVHMDKPGRADAGWWIDATGGASVSTELHDLAPDTPGKQALRIEAAKPYQNASVNSYFDSFAGRSFVQLHGLYRLTFRAKPTSTNRQVTVHLERLDTKHGMESFFSKTLTLDPGWHNYTFDFPTSESGTSVGTVGLSFIFHESSALLDDVSLAPATHSAQNPTAFRDEVVQTLRDLHPGVLRYMDNGTDFGSSLDNMLAPPFARLRAGSSTQEKLREDIPIGLHEFLVLCQAIGAEPWYSMPPGTSPSEAAKLIEYLSSPVGTPYGARRAALGQSAPWSQVFPVIHLELGNEEWNARSFAGSSIADPTAYGKRAGELFAAARSSPYFQPQRFDLIAGAWAVNTWWTQQELAAAPNQQSAPDTLALAPYLFDEFNDDSSVEAVFGPMLAQPEQIDSRPGGEMVQQSDAIRHAPHPTQLAIYEVNLGSLSGSVSQSALNLTLPSLGAGLAVADHMLLMLRDLGVATQAFFALPEYVNDFASTSGPAKKMPLWGSVVDMGGATNLRRPQFLTLQMANQAILPQMIATHISGQNPTWTQAESRNDKIRLEAAHLLQTFAFADGPRRSLILFNLSRTDPLPVTYSGPNSPVGIVHETSLTSANITDSNESQPLVTPHAATIPHFSSTASYRLPPHSMTVLTWIAP